MTNSLSQDIRVHAGNGIGDAEFVELYFGLLHEWADVAERLEEKIDELREELIAARQKRN